MCDKSVDGTACYIFNPDTEMALAASGHSYTPPRKIIGYIDSLALLPALYAPERSTVLIPKRITNPAALPYFGILRAKEIRIVYECPDESAIPIPWGWNTALKTSLAKVGFPMQNLPSDERINYIRVLSHRSLTCKVFEYFKSDSEIYSNRPVCVSTLAEAVKVSENLDSLGKEFVAKLPWSSSGRGVIFNPSEYTMSQMLSRQGALMIEPRWNKVIDFATEWEMTGGKAIFQGLSLFDSNGHAQYAGNVVASQRHLRAKILQYCNEYTLQHTIEILQSALQNLIAGKYNAPLGVDMMCDNTGKINPCVEVNLRMTMGHVALKLHEMYRNMNTPFTFHPGKDLDYE